MKIWELIADVNNFENLQRIGDFDLEMLQSFDGRSKTSDWQPLLFKGMYGNRQWGDIVDYHGHMPIVTRKVIEATQDLLDNNVEILPVLCEGHELFLLNVTKVIECIDYTKAKYKIISERIKFFSKYAFQLDKINNNHIFKLKELPLSSPFVSDEFRQRIIDNGLKGFKFELLWDSEAE